MIRKLFTVALVASGMALAACNTVEGVGEDVSSVGKTTAEVAKDAK